MKLLSWENIQLCCWCVIIAWVMSYFGTYCQSQSSASHKSTRLFAPSIHGNAESDNIHSQVLWVGSTCAMHLTAFGFNIVTVGLSDDWVQLWICFCVPPRHAKEQLYLLLPCKLKTNKMDLIVLFIKCVGSCWANWHFDVWLCNKCIVIFVPPYSLKYQNENCFLICCMKKWGGWCHRFV